MVSTIPLVDTITPRPEPLQPTPHPEQGARRTLTTAPDRTRRSFVRKSDAIIARDRVSTEFVRDGQVVEPSGPSLAERIARLQQREGSDSSVARALEQWSLPEQDPNSLNNILENIREDIWGGTPKSDKGKAAWEKMAQTMAPLMRVPEAQLDGDLRRCRDSLQSRTTVGLTARHGSPRPVANGMCLDQARDFVYRLLRAWIDSKL
jgi:hypothetical protein